MNYITVDPDTRRQLSDAREPIEVYGDNGVLLGVFQPHTGSEVRLPEPPPLSPEELEQRRNESGRPLSEIMRDLRKLA